MLRTHLWYPMLVHRSPATHSQLAEQYGPDVATDVLARSRVNLVGFASGSSPSGSNVALDTMPVRSILPRYHLILTETPQTIPYSTNDAYTSALPSQQSSYPPQPSSSSYPPQASYASPTPQYGQERGGGGRDGYLQAATASPFEDYGGTRRF